jgi:hypothetical protein
MLARWHLHMTALVGTVALLLLLATPGDAGAQTFEAREIAPVEQPTPLAAGSGVVVWSDYRPEAKRWRLMASVGGGAPATLPVRGRAVPFDVDVGVDARERAVLTYSRCRVDPAPSSYARNTPPYGDGRDCRLFEFDVAARRERLLRGVSSAKGSEYLPARWGHRLIFARRGRRAGIVVRDLRSGRERSLPGGPRGTGRADETGPSSLDLRGRAYAVSWLSYGGRCPDHDPEDRNLSFGITETLAGVIGHRSRRVARRCVDTRPYGAVIGASLAAGGVLHGLFIRRPEGVNETTLKATRDTATRTVGRYRGDDLEALTWDGDRIYACVSGGSERGTRIVELVAAG